MDKMNYVATVVQKIDHSRISIAKVQCNSNIVNAVNFVAKNNRAKLAASLKCEYEPINM